MSNTEKYISKYSNEFDHPLTREAIEKLDDETMQKFANDLFMDQLGIAAEYFARIADPTPSPTKHWWSDSDFDYIGSHVDAIEALRMIAYEGRLEDLISFLFDEEPKGSLIGVTVRQINADGHLASYDEEY
jgi:hypothetical protein